MRCTRASRGPPLTLFLSCQVSAKVLGPELKYFEERLRAEFPVLMTLMEQQQQRNNPGPFSGRAPVQFN